MGDEMWEEIRELEREAADLVNSAEQRRVNRIKAALLRNGFRLQQVPSDARLLVIVHLATGSPVYWLSQNELRQAMIEERGWLEIAQQAVRERGFA
jgi:hypothetical protein